jgi:hypothetical protein
MKVLETSGRKGQRVSTAWNWQTGEVETAFGIENRE